MRRRDGNPASKSGPRQHRHSSIEIRGSIDDARRQGTYCGVGAGGRTAFRQSAWDEAKNSLLREFMSVDHAGARLVSSRAEVDGSGTRRFGPGL